MNNLFFSFCKISIPGNFTASFTTDPTRAQVIPLQPWILLQMRYIVRISANKFYVLCKILLLIPRPHVHLSVPFGSTSPQNDDKLNNCNSRLNWIVKICHFCSSEKSVARVELLLCSEIMYSDGMTCNTIIMLYFRVKWSKL